VRVACLRVADLPLAARLRAEPELEGLPLAIAESPAPRAVILVASPPALRLGVRPGQTTAQARTACAELVLRTSTPALEKAARETLRDAALCFSPRVEIAAPRSGLHAAESVVFLDASGIRARWRSEAGFATALSARARSLGLVARAAVAGSRAVALLAARAPGAVDEVRVIAAGEEASWLAPLSIDLLEPSDALATSLSRFGIRRLGELARLPRRALASRLGERALRLAALARGEADDLPIETPEAAEIVEAIDLEAPIDRLEPLRFVLRGVLDRLAARLDARGLGATELDLELALEARGHDARRIGLATPSADPRLWLRVASLALETRPPGAAIEALRVATQGVPVRADQLDLFRPAGPAPTRLARTLAEIEALCGPGRVGFPIRPDTHRCDAFELAPFSLTNAASRPDVPAAPAEIPALRALRPPLAARVRVERGLPAELQSAAAAGRVLGCSGPWRTSGGWWASEGRFAHDHYDVWTQDGHVVRLRHDRLENAWCIDGVYD
jgi:protein ImuB